MESESESESESKRALYDTPKSMVPTPRRCARGWTIDDSGVLWCGVGLGFGWRWASDALISTSSLEDSNESDEGHVMNREELQLLTVAQLRIKLKAVGLKVSGKKDVLIDRLLNPNLHRKNHKIGGRARQKLY
ncbi:hypothetical protein QTG54_004944 [Skeletonema marinoi]|uniref:SAP domain-containing protein n=1 Tax=Skeletonema marinoi TaxID=267567 RepID=A0AAD8YDC9_9STRA|nr:hypothetical protein QTG54_004944 [Skeletonema marinoi]